MLGFVVYAEENVDTQSVEKENRDAFMLKVGENKIKRDEFKNEVKDVKDSLKEERKNKLEEIIQSIKEKRQEFKTQMETDREEAKTKIALMKADFKEDIKKIKDESKKISAEKIVDIIQSLNTKSTDNLSDKIDKIENVLISIESRISKAEEKRLDVSSVKIEVEKAKTAIVSARDAISAQSNKVYEVNITDEASLKAEMKNLRDTFMTDIKTVREKVKLAHTAVLDTATTLAKISKIDEEKIPTEVENTSDTNNN